MRYTPNYDLTQYEDNDVTSYLVHYNGDMAKIDEAMHANATDIAKNQTDLSSVETQLATANDEINNLTAEVSDNTTALQGHTSQIAGIDQQLTQVKADILYNHNQIESVADVAGTVYRGVLSANEETLAIQIGNFDANTLVDVYTDIYGVNPLTIELRAATGGQPNLCVTTWDAQSVDLHVAIVTRGGAASAKAKSQNGGE